MGTGDGLLSFSGSRPARARRRAHRRRQVSREEPLLLPSNVGGGALPLRIAPLEAAAANPEQLMRLLQRHRCGLGRRGSVRVVSHLRGARALHKRSSSGTIPEIYRRATALS
jgi:hypothetical protein